MRVRIKFAKRGCTRFIGHLDTMRYFQKAIRRADIPICFSEGYSPHMIMSFASPIGVGSASEGEYFDIEVKEGGPSSKEAVRALNDTMSEGFEVLSYRKTGGEKKDKAMSLVSAADYLVWFRRKEYEPKEGWQQRLEEFVKQDEILVWKKTKKSEKEINIRPMIYECQIREDGIFFKVASGSEENLKPELIMEAFMNQKEHMEPEPFAFQITRLEMYAKQKVGETSELISLEELGEEIVS